MHDAFADLTGGDGAAGDRQGSGTPWQDRQTLLAPRCISGRVPASGRLAHGFRVLPENHERKYYVRYASS
jgi:hypothetical protein